MNDLVLIAVVLLAVTAKHVLLLLFCNLRSPRTDGDRFSSVRCVVVKSGLRTSLDVSPMERCQPDDVSRKQRRPLEIRTVLQRRLATRSIHFLGTLGRWTEF